jgi:hypothetical protein
MPTTKGALAPVPDYWGNSVGAGSVSNQDPDNKRIDSGPEWFRKIFEKAAHNDDWGVPCVYDYAAWKICKAAMRRQRYHSAKEVK